MGGRRLARVEVAGDLTQALAFRVLCPNAKDELVRDGVRSYRRRGLRAPSRWAAAFSHEPLERGGHAVRKPDTVGTPDPHNHADST
jgi:hypothetical protein